MEHNTESARQQHLDSEIKESGFARFGVRRPHTVIVAILITIVLGVFSLSMLKMELFPNMDIPYVAVIYSRDFDNLDLTVSQEEQLDQALELSNTVQGRITTRVTGIKQIDATVQAMAVVLIIELQTGISTTEAQLHIINAIGDPGHGKLGFNAPLFYAIDLNMMPIVQFSSTYSILNTQAEVNAAQLALSDALSAYNALNPKLAASGMNITTEAIENKETELESAKLSLAGATTAIDKFFWEAEVDIITKELNALQSELNRAISRRDEAQIFADETKVGSINWEATSIWYTDKLQPVINVIPGVATVSMPLRRGQTNAGNSFSYLNGGFAFTVSIQKTSDSATVDVAGAVAKALEDFTKTDEGAGFTYNMTLNQAEYIQDSIGEVARNLIIGGILAIFIIFLFLRNTKATIGIAISIPLSIVGTFVLMYFMGIGLNVVSMGGLALAVGMLTDNSIIVLENIYRLRQKGMGLAEACIKGSSQIFGAILAATLTTIAVFFPLFFVDGLIMSMLMDLVWVIILSLGASMVVATAALPSILNLLRFKPREPKPTESKKPFFQKVDKVAVKTKETYNVALNWTISKNWKKLTVIGSALVLVIGFTLGAFFSNGFAIMPVTDEGEFTVSVSLNSQWYGRDVVGIMDSNASYVSDHAKRLVNGNNLQSNEPGYEEGLTKLVQRFLGNDLDAVAITGGGGGMGAMFGIGGDGDSAPGALSISVALKKNRKKSTAESSELIYNEVAKYVAAHDYAKKEFVDFPLSQYQKLDFMGMVIPLTGTGLSFIPMALPLPVLATSDGKVKVFPSFMDFPEVEMMPGVTMRQFMFGLLEGTPDSPGLYPSFREYGIDTDSWDFVQLTDGGPAQRQELRLKVPMIPPVDIVVDFTLAGTEVNAKLKIPQGFDLWNLVSDVSYSASQMDMLGGESIQVTLTSVAKSGESASDVVERINYAIAEVESKIRASEYDSQILRYSSSYTPGSISEYNGNIIVTLTMQPTGNATVSTLDSNIQALVRDLRADASMATVFDGITSVTVGGFQQMFADTFGAIALALLVGILLIYLVMVAIFRSFVAPLIIMMLIPLAFGGGFLALWIGGMAISVVAAIGFLILAGIIVNNGIVLIDYANQLREDGMKPKEAIVTACNVRARPVFITALSTVLALIPNAIMSGMMQGIAVVGVGGILFATLLTLLVLPAFYTLLYRDKDEADIKPIEGQELLTEGVTQDAIGGNTVEMLAIESEESKK